DCFAAENSHPLPQRAVEKKSAFCDSPLHQQVIKKITVIYPGRRLHICCAEFQPDSAFPFARIVFMNSTEKQSWERVRVKGKSKFILNGIVPRGLKFAVPFTAAFFFTDLIYDRIKNPITEAEYLAMWFALAILLVGWADGAFEWFKKEKDYHATLSNNTGKKQRLTKRHGSKTATEELKVISS
ncbi:MAG TPA: hypothetical protein VHQ01_01795, partial [Pyrinomonadaceae bacterium]|nr:hypothetical protein [Pyrinomonadaceae bacterium]